MDFFVFLLICAFGLSPGYCYRTWICEDYGCTKNSTDDLAKAVSINECKALCLQYGGLWPRPSQNFQLGNTTLRVGVTFITFEKPELPTEAERLVTEAENIFLTRIIDESATDQCVDSNDSAFSVKISIEIRDPSILHFTTDTDESYNLTVKTAPDGSKKVQVKISGNTFFGVRHGLETLSQLFFYDDIHHVYRIVSSASIQDKPVYKHRGVILDSARSYITIDSILKTLDNMAANKLNNLHWHITDSQSFPYVSKSYPQLSELGAYSKREIYTEDDIKKIVEYARVRGIRVVPEFDAPAHVGEGWVALDKNLIVCFKYEPWRSYCQEPPCGQFDPTNEKVYEMLGNIYKEYADLFPSDLFHFGGDEVNLNCWNSTPKIVDWMKNNDYSNTTDSFLDLWALFQAKVYEKLKIAKRNPQPQGVIWTSKLTEAKHIKKYLNPNNYIIQLWSKKNDHHIEGVIKNGFRVIFSNYDELYLDCGGPSWLGPPGENWCPPYINWQHVYEHSPIKIVRNFNITPDDAIRKLILGSEVAIWSEQQDDKTFHQRLWPRAAALAERLWADPSESWSKYTRYRINHQRERLVKINPIAELLQPKWCYQNDGFCE